MIELKNYAISRRLLLKSGFLTIALSIFSRGELFAEVVPLETIALLQEDLFPLAKELESRSDLYMLIILSHSKIAKKDKKFIRNGVKWLNEEALSEYKKIYTKLSSKQRQSLLQKISKERWGEHFIYTILQYTLESLLGDPIYGINKNQKGWEWLEHKSGYPRPKSAFL